MLTRNTLLTCTLAALLLGCGSDETPQAVTLAELKAAAARYDGKIVRTRGRVKMFPEPRHYWLEDDNINRVELLPEDVIAPHLDRRISVTGRFSYSRERGRRIQIDEISAYDAHR